MPLRHAARTPLTLIVASRMQASGASHDGQQRERPLQHGGRVYSFPQVPG